MQLQAIEKVLMASVRDMSSKASNEIPLVPVPVAPCKPLQIKSVLAVVVHVNPAAPGDISIGVSFVRFKGDASPTMVSAHLSLAHAVVRPIEGLFPGYDSSVTHVILEHGLSSVTDATLMRWLRHPAVVMAWRSPVPAALDQHVLLELTRLVQSGSFALDDQARPFKDALLSAPKCVRSMFVVPREATKGPVLATTSVVPATALVMLVTTLKLFSAVPLCAPDTPAAFAPALRRLLGGTKDAPACSLVSECSMKAASSGKRKAGAAPLFECPAAKVPRVSELLGDHAVEALDTGHKWFKHFGSRSFLPGLPASFSSPELKGKLIVWSYRTAQINADVPGPVDWDCAIIHKFDMTRRQALLQQAYPPYNTYQVTSANWTIDAAHFVYNVDDAKLNPQNPSFLPWLFAEYPDYPCAGFPGAPL